jgi:Protein of unknown function (DUF4038)
MLASLAEWLPRRFAHYGTSVASLFADFTSPNEEYFAHADWVLRRAAEKGFLVLLTPSYAGWRGGSQGWYRAMVANGPRPAAPVWGLSRPTLPRFDQYPLG